MEAVHPSGLIKPLTARLSLPLLELVATVYVRLWQEYTDAKFSPLYRRLALRGGAFRTSNVAEGPKVSLH